MPSAIDSDLQLPTSNEREEDDKEPKPPQQFPEVVLKDEEELVCEDGDDIKTATTRDGNNREEFLEGNVEDNLATNDIEVLENKLSAKKGNNVNGSMEKIVEPFTSLIGEKITTSLHFYDNEQALKGNLKVLTSKASDIETEVKKAELSGRKRRSMEVGTWLEKVKKFKEECGELNDKLGEGGSIKRRWHGSHVKKLKEGVGELIQQSETFRELVVDECETSRERLFTTQLHGETLKQHFYKIWAWLEEESDQVPIIGIYRMQGVGKTTLAKHIYKHICTNLQGTPDKFYVYWISISQKANIDKLQNDMAKKLNFDLPEDYDVDEKAAILHKLLIERKNVVLIFDDVWEYFDLEKIGILFKVNRCKVIITSRLRDVCNQMGCKETFKVEPLSEE